MSDLENTFGSEFAEQYKQEIAKRREERQRVTDEVRAEVANLAINEGKFKDGDPNFSLTTDADVTHDVLLMQLPQLEGKSVFGYANELDSGAVTCPLDYMGEWMSCLFNDPDDLKRMEEGEHYIIIGNMDQWENDQGQLNDQVSPVRGVLSLDEAKELAEAYLEGDIPESEGDSSSSSEEEESDGSGDLFAGNGDEEEEDEEEDGSGGGLDGFLSEEEDEGVDVEYEKVAGIVETLAEKDEVVWDLERGDDRVGKVVKITVKQLELDEDDDEVENAVRDHVLNRISEGPEAEEEEDEDEEDEEDKMF